MSGNYVVVFVSNLVMYLGWLSHFMFILEVGSLRLGLYFLWNNIFDFRPFSTTNSTMSRYSEPQKPQSIIHLIGRLGSKMAKSLYKRRRANSGDLESIGDYSALCSLKSVPQLVSTTEHGDNSTSSSVHENCAYDSPDEFGNESIEESFQDSVDDYIAEEVFETLDQAKPVLV
jgi:hypothetical protein